MLSPPLYFISHKLTFCRLVPKNLARQASTFYLDQKFGIISSKKKLWNCFGIANLCPTPTQRKALRRIPLADTMARLSATQRQTGTMFLREKDGPRHQLIVRPGLRFQTKPISAPIKRNKNKVVTPTRPGPQGTSDLPGPNLLAS